MNTPLHIACHTKALRIIRLLLDRKCSTNIPNKEGETAEVIPLNEDEDHLLHIACRWGNVDIVRYLITDQTCNPNVQNASSNTPLNASSEHGNLDVIKILVSRKDCDLNIPNERGNTPLHTACKHGHHSTVESLVADQRCQLNTQNREGETPLHIASEHGDLDTVKSLMSCVDCDPNVSHENGNTALHTACKYGHHSVVELLVADQRCQLNAKNREGETPLHIASEHGDLDTVKSLMSSEDCDPNVSHENGNTALHTACKYGHHSVVELLVADQRCQLNAKNREGGTPLHIASEQGYLDTIKALIGREECDLNVSDEKGNTPLHTACQHGRHSTVEYLVADQRCKLNSKNCEMNTPLHIACHTKALRIIRLLLDRKSSTNIPNKEGETAEVIPLNEDGDCLLHIACRWGNVDIVRYLITDQTYNPNVQNTSSNTPLNASSEHGNLDVIKILVSRKDCDLNVPNERGNTPLHTACKHGHHSTVEFLIADQKCQLNTQNREGETPLHIAIGHGNLDMVNLLVGSRECDLSITDERGNTPLLLACHRKALAIVKLLIERKCSTHIPNKKGETAQEIPLNEDGDYLLHIACLQWGDVAIIRYLVTDQKCDPNILNKYHLTPLLATIKHGKPSVAVALLQYAKCDLSLHDQAGNTALHLACIHGQTHPEMVKVAKNLIISADQLSVNSAGQTPIELTTNYELIQAISHFTECKTKHSVQTYINLFIVGNPETGKSTLVKAICKEANIFWKIVPKVLRRVKNVQPHTAGIIPTTFRSRTFGNTVLYDLAGQIEYYTSHAAVIQTTVISTPPAFIIVVNMSESEEKISETLRYWWSFINNHAAQASAPPQVILVGSHADKVKARGGSVQENMSQVSALLKCLPTSFYFAGQVALDCRDPASSELRLFCSLVNKACVELRKTADVDLHCHVLYSFLLEKFPGKVACTVSDITTTIQESDALLPQNPDGLIPLISTLSDKGLLFLVADSVGNEGSWVILQKQVLLGEINGAIFAPKEFSQHKKDLSTSTGVVPLLLLKSEFPDYNPQMIAKFLTHLEFCFKVDDHETLELLKDEIVHEKMPQNPSEEYYFFPALVSVENPLQVWEQDDVMISQCGWLYRCSQHDQFLTTQFLHVLILRLAFSFALQLHPGDFHEDSLVLHRRCSVWKHGIGWLNRVPFETVVEVGLLNQSVIVMMRCPKGEEAKCAQLRSEIIQKVIGTKDELCKATKMSESFIHPADIKYPFIDNTEGLKYYSLTEIAVATVKGAYNVLDNRGRNPFPMKDLLLFDPQTTTSRELLRELFSEKHSLDEQVRGQVLEKLLEGEIVHRELLCIHPSIDHIYSTELLIQILLDWLEMCAVEVTISSICPCTQ